MMFESGEIAITSSGRLTKPFPKIDTSTDRKTLTTIKRINDWLVKEGVSEASETGNEWMLTILPKDNINLSQSDIDTLNEYLSLQKLT